MKETRSEYLKKYRAEHRDEQKAYMAAYYAENREKLKARAAAIAKANPERTKASSRKWKAANPEKHREFQRRSYEKNLEKYRPRRRELEKIRMTDPEARKKVCANARRYRGRNPGKDRPAKMDWHYRSKYGITVAERDRLFEAQGKRCKICQSDSSTGRGFHVDHCHRTNKNRGILCHNCNILLGNAKDDIATLEAAIQYLKESE